MNYSAYIERQKKLIRSRHEGEVFLFQKGEAIELTNCERLFCELEKSRGLNTRERSRAAC